MKKNNPERSGNDGQFGFTGRRTFLRKAATVAAGALVAPKVIGSGKDPDGLPQKRYPDSSIVVLDKRFEKYFIWNTPVERLWTGALWGEGPVWFGDGRYLLFSDIPNNRILRWNEDNGQVSVFRQPSNNSNGNTRDRQGRLITCEHDTQRITRTEYEGTINVLMDRYQGKPCLLYTSDAANDLHCVYLGGRWMTHKQ